jgi:hypothetical protein
VANPSSTFAAAGTFSVTLTVSDQAGASATVTQNVTVVPTTTQATSLRHTSFVKYGRQYVTLLWSGLKGSSADIYQDGRLVESSPNDGRQNVLIPISGKASYIYKVCEKGTSRCTASVTFTMPTILLNVAGWMKEYRLQAMLLQWAGANGTNVNVYRNGQLIQTVSNTGRFTNTRAYRGSATYSYKVCEVGTSRCSNTASVTFQ